MTDIYRFGSINNLSGNGFTFSFSSGPQYDLSKSSCSTVPANNLHSATQNKNQYPLEQQSSLIKLQNKQSVFLNTNQFPVKNYHNQQTPFTTPQRNHIGGDGNKENLNPLTGQYSTSSYQQSSQRAKVDNMGKGQKKRKFFATEYGGPLVDITNVMRQDGVSMRDQSSSKQVTSFKFTGFGGQQFTDNAEHEMKRKRQFRQENCVQVKQIATYADVVKYQTVPASHKAHVAETKKMFQPMKTKFPQTPVATSPAYHRSSGYQSTPMAANLKVATKPPVRSISKMR
ncbi:hypothetical protein MP228_002973 [Amoeboaphelidium protococcarum]|nr:hypothetical protein MP228_002973 [Amoeboaphelidium protococcarum]